MTYSIKEMFYTLQGEGAQAGRAAVFCRFSGCNLWSGREADRASAECQFCDTDFVGVDGVNGGKFESPHDLAALISTLWPSGEIDRRYVVCTGGEPLLQLDEPLIEALHDRGFQVAIETNGTLPIPRGVDWICVSPKGHTSIVAKRGHELKLVYPQAGVDPKSFQNWEFDHFFIQPMDGPLIDEHVQLAIEYCQQNPIWRFGAQMHKMVGLK